MNKITYPLLFIFFASLLTANLSMADTLTLKDGQVLKGSLVSKDASGVVFSIGGQNLKFDSANVASISFGDSGATPAPSAAKSTTATENTKSKAAVAPAGTRVVAKITSPIDSKRHSAGHKFTANLEADIVAGGVVVAPKGSQVYGVILQAQKSGRLLGKASLELSFTDIMINNKMNPIKTSGVKAVTESTTKTSVGRTARFAAVGALVNGSDGAKDGAKIGLGVSILTSGNSINIPAGTIVEFQLTAPLSQ